MQDYSRNQQKENQKSQSQLGADFIQSSQLLSIMSNMVKKFDNRVRLIEENQNKIANSLSKFLDRMNALLFKDQENANGKKSSSELDSVALQKGLFPNFADEILQQVHDVLINQQECSNLDKEVQNMGEIKEQLTSPFLPKNNNYIQFQEAVPNKTQSVAQSYNQLPISSILQEYNRSATENSKSFTSLNNQGDISDKSSTHQSQMSSQRKEDNDVQTKSSPRDHRAQTAQKQKMSRLTSTNESNLQQTPNNNLNRNQNTKSKNSILSPKSQNLASASYSGKNSRPQTQAQVSKNEDYLASNTATARRLTSGEQLNNNHIDFQPREKNIMQQQTPTITARNRFDTKPQQQNYQHHQQDKSQTRALERQLQNQQQAKVKDNINNNNRPKSSTRPEIGQQNNLQKKTLDKTQTQDVKAQKNMQLQPTPNRQTIQEKQISSQNQKVKENSQLHSKTQSSSSNMKPQTLLKSNKSPREIETQHITSNHTQYLSQPSNTSKQSHKSPRYETNTAAIIANSDINQKKKETIAKESQSLTQSKNSGIISNLADFELQRPNRESIQNNILVEDQSNDSQNQPRTTFKYFTGDILDCIQEFTGEEFPQFVFTNKSVLTNYIIYQSENWQLQKDMMDEQIDELKAELQNGGGSPSSKAVQFLIPEELYEKQEILEDAKSWDTLIKQINQNKMTEKEVTVLRIYFTFLNVRDTLPQDSNNTAFIKNVLSIIKKHGNNFDELNHPEQFFKFTDDIKYRAMELMMQVDLNELIQAKFSPLIEAMLFIVVEAIQHLDNVQNNEEDGETEINTLEFVRDSYKDKLQVIDSLSTIINLN
eukprot:403339946